MMLVNSLLIYGPNTINYFKHQKAQKKQQSSCHVVFLAGMLLLMSYCFEYQHLFSSARRGRHPTKCEQVQIHNFGNVNHMHSPSYFSSQNPIISRKDLRATLLWNKNMSYFKQQGFNLIKIKNYIIFDSFFNFLTL